jgi:predicted ABC-type ATPase
MSEKSVRKADIQLATKPNLWMIAGPNGSGKSTFYTKAQIIEDNGPLWIINPDLLTFDIAAREGINWLNANSKALDRIKLWLEASIEMYKPVGFETVLSSDKYLPMIDHALEIGYEFRLIYVALKTPELHIQRVRKRVSEGGHDVEKEKIISRRLKSFDRLQVVLPKARFAQIWDNSGKEPELLFEKNGEEIIAFNPDAIPEITERVKDAFP